MGVAGFEPARCAWVPVAAACADADDRDGHGAGVGPADVAVGGQPTTGRGRVQHGQGDADDGIGAQPGLVGRAVQLDHQAVDLALRGYIHAAQGWPDLVVDGRGRVAHAQAIVAFAAVEQKSRFVGSRGHARLRRGHAAHAVVGLHNHFQPQQTALGKDFACLDRSEERRVGKECSSRWSPDH